MYTLEQLQQKSLKELKEIGWELNVFPEGDRRYRENWINAIAGVNPPLLQPLETASEDVLDEELPSEEEARSIVSQYFISTASKEIRNAPPPARVFYPGQYVRIVEVVGCRNSQFCGSIGIVAEHHFNVWVWVELDGGGRKIVICRPEKLELIELVVATKQEPIALAAKTSPGVEVDPVEDLPECSECFDDGFIEDELGFITICQCEPKLSRQNAQRAIVRAANISQSDQNRILMGICLSDRFLARYSPPQSETLHYEIADDYKADADGQLSLFEARAVTEPEPPDPDDFASIDAFRKAIALWDAQHPEPPAVSLDSMCEWAPCPAEWYEPKAEILPLKASSTIELPEQSEVMELSITSGSSITSDFFIPTFGSWGDRFDGSSDEPPDTGTFAYRPKPKPPNFPPQASWAQVGHKLDTSQPKSAQVRLSQAKSGISELFRCSVAGSSIQPARSPPGGDAFT